MTKRKVSSELKLALESAVELELESFLSNLNETAIIIFKQSIEKRNGSNTISEENPSDRAT